MTTGRTIDRAKLMNGIGENIRYNAEDPLGSYSALLAYINDFPAEEDNKTDITSSLRRTIAIDFDGCLCTEEWPEIGAPNWPVISAAKYEKAHGAALILWTCREGKLLEDAVEACKSWGLEFDAVNSSTPEWIAAWGGDTRKVGATEYWDDRAVSFTRKDNWERIPGLRIVDGKIYVDGTRESEPVNLAPPDLIRRLEDAVFQMERNIHSPGHIAAVLDAIKALR